MKKISIFNIFIVYFILSTVYVTTTLSMNFEEDKISDNYSSPELRNNIHSPIESEDIPFIMTEEDGDTEDKRYFFIFIQKYLVQHDKIPESQSKKIVRSIAQFSGGTMGGLAGIPYFEVGKEAGGENEVIAWGMGITTMIAISGVGSWSYSNLLRSLDPQSIEEENSLQKRKWIAPAHILSHGLGLIGAVPTAYLAARFNTYKWLAGISYGLEYSLKTNGFLAFLKILSQKNQDDQSSLGEDHVEISTLLVQHLSKKTIPAIITMQDEEINELVRSLYQEDNLTVEGYLTCLLDIPPRSIFLEETPETWKKGYPKKAFIGGLCLSSLLNIVHNFHCAYNAWNMIYDYPAFVIPMATISVIPTFILESRAAINIGGSLYDSAFYYALGTPYPSLAQSLYPKAMKILPIICASLAGVTSYVGRFMVIDVLSDFFSYKYAVFFAVGGVLGPFLFNSYSNYSLVQDIILSYTRSYGEESKKKLCSLIQDIEKLLNVLNFIKKEEMVKFLENENIQDTLSVLKQVQEVNSIEESTEEPREQKKSIWCGIL